MNRRHTSDIYMAVIDKLRTVRPDIAMSGDFIVGFPGESDQDFADTLALVSKVGYASAYSFKYSPRPGTPAANAEKQVPDSVKSERLEKLATIAQMLSNLLLTKIPRVNWLTFWLNALVVVSVKWLVVVLICRLSILLAKRIRLVKLCLAGCQLPARIA